METKLQQVSRKLSRKEHSRPGAYTLTQENTGLTYIGSTGNIYERICSHYGRLRAGEHRNSNLQNAFNNDPRFNLSICETDTREEALKIEQVLLDNLHGSALNLNIASHVSKPGLNRPMDPDTKQLIKNSCIIRYEDPEQRKLQSEIATNLWNDPQYREKQEASLEKRSIASKERWEDPAYLAKMAEYRNSESAKEQAAKIGIRSSKPVTIEGVTYPSIQSAADSLGIKRTTLSGRLNKK